MKSQSFLNKVALDLIEKYSNFKDVVCVLPSERACFFLKNKIQYHLSKAAFLPEIITIEKFIADVSGLQNLDNIPLLFRLFEVYKKVNSNNSADDFEQFLKWAPVFLSDCNEIDRFLIPSEELFSVLSDIERFRQDLSDESALSLIENQSGFSKMLGILYKRFTQDLISSKDSYQGLQYRQAANNIDQYLKNHINQSIAFIGFNALNKAEEIIFQSVLDNHKGLAYWDIDKSFLKNDHIAGHFIRQYQNNWTCYKKEPISFVDDALSREKNINVIGANGSMNQMLALTNILKNNIDSKSTALVLADENLLTPALQVFGNQDKGVNVTMGYSYISLPIYTFIKQLFYLHINTKKYKHHSPYTFYFKDLEKVWNHPIFVRRLKLKQQAVYNDFILKANIVFVIANDFEEILNNHFFENSLINLFSKPKSPKQFIDVLIHFVKGLMDNVSGFEQVATEGLFYVLEQLKHQIQDKDLDWTINSLFLIFDQLIKNENLSFQGEPLEGLQIKGMLETRALDYENIAFTSLNEGVLPKSGLEQSFIPFDIKKTFKMPTYYEKDAVYAYHFFRLFKEAKNINIVFNSNYDQYGGGEMSRFIHLLSLHGVKNIELKQFVSTSQFKQEEPFEVCKDKTILESFKVHCKSGLSASALITYLRSPIEFYKKYVLQIKPPKTVEESFEANTMGTIVHDILEALYKPYINEVLSEHHFKKIKGEYDKVKNEIILKVYGSHFIEEGMNHIYSQIIDKIVLNTIDEDKKTVLDGGELIILAVEDKYSVNIESDQLDFPLVLSGKIDRIDQLNGQTRIIDYKTGKIDVKQFRVSDFEEIKTKDKQFVVVQMLVYIALYYGNKIDNSNQIITGLLALKKPRPTLVPLLYKGEKVFNKDNLAAIHEFLVSIVKEIADINIPFKEKE